MHKFLIFLYIIFMSNSSFAFDENQLNYIRESLFFLKIDELRTISKKFNLNYKENKLFLIEDIVYFLKNNQKPKPRTMPEISISKKNVVYKIDLNEQILYGHFKNNYETRDFFKKHIGDHFHFTVFAIDWVNKNWHEGTVITYSDYIDMWKSQFSQKHQLKDEWMYMRFVKEFLQKNNNITQKQVNTEWKKEREKRFKYIANIINIT